MLSAALVFSPFLRSKGYERIGLESSVLSNYTVELLCEDITKDIFSLVFLVIIRDLQPLLKFFLLFS